MAIELILQNCPFPGFKKKRNTSSYKKRAPESKTRRSSTFADITRESHTTQNTRQQWAIWLTTVIVSLHFGLAHKFQHGDANQKDWKIRYRTITHVILTTILGLLMHILTLHRGLTVSIIRHVIHNTCCELLPKVRQNFIYFKYVVDIGFRLPNYTLWINNKNGYSRFHPIPIVYVKNDGYSWPKDTKHPYTLLASFPNNAKPGIEFVIILILYYEDRRIEKVTTPLKDSLTIPGTGINVIFHSNIIS